MINIREISYKEKSILKSVIEIHFDAFQDFFLTSLGKGFLFCLYKCYCKHKKSGLLVAFDNNTPVGFAAFSGDYSNLFKYMIRTRLFCFAWYSFLAFLRKPKIFFRLLRSFKKSNDVKREEQYIELASIGIKKELNSKGIGTEILSYLKKIINFDIYAYILLETDATNNERVNSFYKKNGFVIDKVYKTREGRMMNEYIFYSSKNK